jgi:uncharacterized protein (DUF1800 family)
MRISFWIALLLSPLAAASDVNGDGMCDVWQARYHAHGLDPDDDSDGDGRDNRAEAIAGTDPFKPGSGFAARIDEAADGVAIKASTEPGKLYQLLHAPAPDGPWTAEGAPQQAHGAELVLPGSSSGGQRFYRVSVTDSDSDADGVSDWAEMQLAGFEPANPNSFTTPGGDLAAVEDWLAQLAGGQLAAVVTQAAAYEKEATPAVIHYARSGDSGRPFTLFLKTKGPDHGSRSAAAPGEWFFTDGSGQPLTHRLVIPSGESSAELRVHPVADPSVEVPEHLRVLVGGSSLESGVTIADASPVAANQRLLVAYLRPLPGLSSLGSGVATIRLPGDNDTALVALSFSNLNSPVNSTQVLTENSAILQSVPPFNYGGQPWPIRASQNFLTDQAVLDALLSGSIQLGIYTEANVTGEISGFFQITSGSTEFQLPPEPQPLASLAGDELDRDIVRFLTQATFGPTPEDVQALRDLVATHSGDRIAAYSAWIDAQFAAASPGLEAYTRAANDQEIALYSDPSKTYYNPARDPSQNNRRHGWWLLARHAPDQLRQRVAFALSEIFVISDGDTVILNRSYGAANYYDMLKSSASGTYRGLLEGVALHPIMAQYLSHLKNQKALLDTNGNPITSPDENFAREIMQLFSIGLVELHPDGSLKLGPDGLPITSYTQNDIAALARVFTGWSFSKRNNPSASTTVVDNTNFFQSNGSERYEASWTNPLKLFPAYHDTAAKSWLGLELPAGRTGEEELADVLDHLAAHPNTAPFICRRLIQRLVTANPSPGYLYRVSNAFTSSGGNLGETVRAILLDSEARSPAIADGIAGAGKVREPLLRYLALLRAFGAKSELLLADLAPYGYPAEELAKFPAGTTRVRLGDTDSSLGQTPQSAPSVFNWFLPDFSPSGPVSANGLVSPELQIANENSTFTSTNYLYTIIDTTTGQGGTALVNQTEDGSPYTANSDNLIIPYATTLEPLYLAVMDTNGDGLMTNLDTGAFNNLGAIRNACEAVLDHVDLMLCGGALKARYGNTPGQPRAIILDAAVAVRSGSNNSNTAATQATSMRERIEDIVWLVASSPEFVVQK